jgi:polyhydroxyalkanoate synthesis regulator phasin
MKLTTILLGGAALVGLGIYLSRKFSAKNNEDESFVYASEKESRGEKIRKASMFAVGAIKTGADKIAEGIKDIRNQDMVKKGEDTIDSAKETAGDFAHGIKEKVVSAVSKVGKKDEDEPLDLGEEDVVGESDDYFMAVPLEDEDEQM